MKKLALVIALALGLGGCAQFKDAVTFATASVNNPVTPTMLYEVENVMIVAAAGLRAYKRSCVDLAIPQSCRTVINQIRVYTLKLPPLLTNLRSFVRDNDQVNAALAYNAIRQLVADIKTIAAANNITVGAL